MQGATISEYTELRRENSALFIRKVATNDAISRITNKNFSKPNPEVYHSVASINPNRYSR